MGLYRYQLLHRDDDTGFYISIHTRVDGKPAYGGSAYDVYDNPIFDGVDSFIRVSLSRDPYWYFLVGGVSYTYSHTGGYNFNVYVRCELKLWVWLSVNCRCGNVA